MFRICFGALFILDDSELHVQKIAQYLVPLPVFTNRLTNAIPKTLSICLDVELLVESNNYDLLATALTYFEQKKLNVILLEKFDEMPEEFESNSFTRNSIGIQKAGNGAIRMMKWLIADHYYDIMNYYNLIATALTAMKGDKLNVTKRNFVIINDRH